MIHFYKINESSLVFDPSDLTPSDDQNGNNPFQRMKDMTEEELVEFEENVTEQHDKWYRWENLASEQYKDFFKQNLNSPDIGPQNIGWRSDAPEGYKRFFIASNLPHVCVRLGSELEKHLTKYNHQIIRCRNTRRNLYHLKQEINKERMMRKMSAHYGK